MSNHAVVVLETTEGQPMSLEDANETCRGLRGGYTEDYPNGLKVTARLTESKAVFTLTGRLGWVDNRLQSLSKPNSLGPGGAVAVQQRVLTVKSCTVLPEPPKPPRGQSSSAAPVDDGYNQMMDLVYKMSTLGMQGFDS